MHKRRFNYTDASVFDVCCGGVPWVSALGYWRMRNDFEDVRIYSLDLMLS